MPIAPQFFDVSVDSLVTDGKRAYRVTHLLSVDTVLAVDVESGEPSRVAIETLRPYEKPEGESADQVELARELMDFTEEEWAAAQFRFQVIKPYLDDPSRSDRAVEAIAAKIGVHKTTVYRWAGTFLRAGHVSALVPERRGRKVGTTLLEPAVEAVVASVIEDFYLKGQKIKPAVAIEEVGRRCRLAKVATPHPNTVRNRIAAIPEQEGYRRRGQKDKAARFVALRGSFPGATHPMSVVQIDHTPADIICVDDVYRKPVARPFLTVAIDVFSRMVVGFYLSYDPPSAASVALCLAQAMCSKREYLAGIEVPGSWPVWGRIGTVHCDNAKEFRGAVLERACEEYGINLAWRPVKTPRYGGHIENMMGRVAREMHTLPGTTFSNVGERGDYDSEGESAMTIGELEQHLADFFVNKYHLKTHSKLGMSPKRKWETGLTGEGDMPGIGLMPVPQDPERILLDFMPFIERTVQTYGLQLDLVNYYDPVLDPYVNASDPETGKKRLFTVRRDPRDISRVHFYDPTAKRYFPIPYRDLSRPAISLYELEEAKRMLNADGRSGIDEMQVFEAIERMRRRVDAAVVKTKAARRQTARRPRAAGKESTSPPPQVVAETTSRQGAIAVPPPYRAPNADEDLFAEPVAPFEETSL